MVGIESDLGGCAGGRGGSGGHDQWVVEIKWLLEAWPCISIKLMVDEHVGTGLYRTLVGSFHGGTVYAPRISKQAARYQIDMVVAIDVGTWISKSTQLRQFWNHTDNIVGQRTSQRREMSPSEDLQLLFLDKPTV